MSSKEKVQVKTRSGRVASRISLTNIQENKSHDVKKSIQKTAGKTKNNAGENATTTSTTGRRTRIKENEKSDFPLTALKPMQIFNSMNVQDKSKHSHEGKLTKIDTSIDTNSTRNSTANVRKTKDKELSGVIIKNLNNSSKRDTSKDNAVQDTKHSKCTSRPQSRINESDQTILNNNSPQRSPENVRKSIRLSYINFEAAGSSTPIVNKKVSKSSATKTSNEESTQDAKINTKKNPSKVPLHRKTNSKVISPTKQVQSKSNIKTLRPRRANKKYADFENSETVVLETEEEKEEVEHKSVPIYNKALKQGRGAGKTKKDVYEFEVDSCEQSQSDSDNEYDKGMIEEMQLIKKHERKQTAAAIKKKIASKTKNKVVLPEVVIKKYKNNKIEVKEVKEAKKQVSKEEKKLTVLQNIQVNTLNKVEPPKVNNDQNNVDVEQSDGVISQDGEGLIYALVDSFIDDEEASESKNNFETLGNSTGQFKRPTGTLVKIPARAFRRPFANSTMTLSSRSPSRTNLVFRNGPYMLQTKGDNLPSFNQDIVLNSTIAEAHESFFNSRISAILPSSPKCHEDNVSTQQKRTKQSSILKYIPGRQSDAEELHCTLFDENLLLSPVKNSTPIRPVNSPDKKRALRDISNLHANIINTPERDASDVEFFALSASVDRVRLGKPTRFIVKSPKKVNEAPVWSSPRGEKAPVETSVFDSPASQLKDDGECSKDVVGIFEDYDALEVTRQELPTFTYGRRRKRVRRISYNSDDEEEASFEEEQKRKRRKKKGEMTKKEKEQLNVWANSFNEMCDEIDQYSLEVE